MNSYSKITKLTTIIEKLSRLTEARGATADEAAIAVAKIAVLQRKIAQLRPKVVDVPRQPITATRFVWVTKGEEINIRAAEHAAQDHKDWFILLKRIQRLDRTKRSRTHH